MIKQAKGLVSYFHNREAYIICDNVGFLTKGEKIVNITFLLPGYPWKPSGGFRVVYEYANYFVKSGHKVSIFHPRRLGNTDNEKFYLKSRAILRNIRDCLFRPNIDWQNIDNRVCINFVPSLLYNNIKFNESDIYIATAWQTAEYLMNYPISNSRKFYLIQGYETWDGPKDRVDATWKASMKKIVVAKWLYELGCEMGASDLCHIPNGIDLNKYCIHKRVSNRVPRVAMLYSKLSIKGSNEGIEALIIAKRKLPSLQAVLFGVNRRPSTLPKWIEYYRNPSQQYLVEEIYNGSSVYLCSSWFEGWGLPVAEAMACGCAIVTTACKGIDDFVIHRKNALVVEIKNSDKMASALIEVLSNDTLRKDLAKEGLTKIQELKWNASATKFLHYLERDL
ncbi:MAG: glycosyl transferase family 1 [Firmicutes bacterium]|nr:glycosyl transferase family 1 [Bacillota bacterium]